MNPPVKDFGGKDSVKENRQGCISHFMRNTLRPEKYFSPVSSFMGETVLQLNNSRFGGNLILSEFFLKRNSLI